MPNSLKELRIGKNIPARDMVEVVRRIHPKYDTTMQSKCENTEMYGIRLTNRAMAELYRRFDPDGTFRKGRSAADGHKLKHSVRARITGEDAQAVLQKIAEDGYETVQDWLSDVVSNYIKEKE